MRLLYVSDVLNIHDQRFLSIFAQAGFEVLVYTFYHQTPTLPDGVLNISGLKIIRHTFSVFPYGLGTRLRFSLLKMIAYKTQENKAIKMLARDIEILKPDIVFASWLLTSGYITAKAGFKKIVSMPWGSDVVWLPYIKMGYLKRTITAIQGSHFITCNCQHIKMKMLEFVPSFPEHRIWVIPWGIDPAIFNPQRRDTELTRDIQNGKIIIICTRMFDIVYRHDILVDVINRLYQNRRDFQVLLLGDGPTLPAIKRKVKELGLEQVIKLVGRVENNKIAYYLNISDIYISASKHDGTSLCLEEAMMCGLPVVVVDYPSNREWVKEGENGFLFRLTDIDSAAAKLQILMDNLELRKSMGRKNHQLAMREFDINHTSKKFVELLKIACAS